MLPSPGYTQELEKLITNVLLPVFEIYQKDRGIQNPLKYINPKLLDQVKHKEKLPALLRKK